MSDLDRLLEQLVPGAGHRSLADADAPPFPAGLGLEPLAVIARGSVGWVYRARDPVLDRVVAVKVARAEGGEAARKALLAEARTTARIAGPGVLPVHGVAAAEGRLCVVFALAPERTLADRVAAWRSEPGPPERRIRCVLEIASALARAHAVGLAHGDLKPANVAVDGDDRPFVLDWGGVGDEPGTFSGTPEYAAPERIRGGPPSAAADVWALGALAWEVLAGRVLRPAIPSEGVAAYLSRHARGASADPADLAGVDPDLAALLVRAVDPEPAARPATAALADALVAALTGRAERGRRREEAEALLGAADRELAVLRERERRLDEEKRVVAVQQAKVPPWAPPADKRTMWAATGRLLRALDEQAESWTAALEHAQVATALAPGSGDARIAELWWERLRMAELRGYLGEAALAERRVRARDHGGRFTALLDARAWLTLTSSAPARVSLARVRPGRLAEEVPVSELDAPLARVELDPGGWVATVRAAGCAVRVSLRLDRLEHLELSVRIPDEVPERFVLVPAGPFRMGGDDAARHAVERCAPWLPDLLVARTAVTSGEYLAFLRDLDPAEAAVRAPAERLANGRVAPLWDADGLPTGWDPRWPVVGVDRASAEAYAAWASARTGLGLRLPAEEEWEKAARGADGRAFPWGDAFDPSLCHAADALPGARRLLPVGSFPTDRSVYGVQDVAGSVQEWTTSTFAADRTVVRGGSWTDDAQACRLASRAGAPADERRSNLGFRLFADVYTQSGSGILSTDIRPRGDTSQ